jgi:DNA mismatch repair protein MutL
MKIKLLDEETVNQIAAGEVIERPASVVKELTENSIDSGATRILIEVVDGGRSLIKVTDDGCGIEPQEVAMAFQRHATSKISKAEDLYRIRTLGFRGEALSSIASVSRTVELITRPRTHIFGTYLRLDNGQIAETKEAGCPVGTSIAVRGLFHNIPARRKHLKGGGVELAKIAELVTEMAIINHQVSFQLYSGKRELFRSRRADSWDDALLQAFGLDVVKELMPFQGEIPGGRFQGLVGSPLLWRSTPDWVLIYVNGRAVSSRPIMAALRQAFGSMLPAGRSPVAVIALEISAGLVDVNVHPTKREVRLLREDETVEALTSAVSAALRARAPKTPEEQLKKLSPELRPARELEMALTQLEPEISQKAQQKTLPLEGGTEAKLTLADSTLTPLRILGQAMDLYIVAEGREGLVLIDQHAAEERIRYEQIGRRYKDRCLAQELIEPITIELSPKEMVLLDSWTERLKEVGFELVAFGGNAYQVRSVPTTGYRLESPEAIHDILLDLFALGKVGEETTSREEIIKLLACRGAVKSGDPLTPEEMRQILRDLLACQEPWTCPHGRPTMIQLSSAQLERIFGRR